MDTADLATLSAATLSPYDVVVLGQVSLSAAQVTTLTTWVNGGGRLIALRPDKQLSSLLGLSDAGSTLSNGYLLVNTASSPGAGIVGQTIQFHGTADLYTLNGATAIATLYSNATAATPYPAITLRTNIGAGGSAAAFTYDLASSIVYTRQGNPAWISQARIQQGGPKRSSDMFYGPASFDPQPNWIDLSKVAIPQADEQQRLLANLILHLTRDKKPIPRFWYLPFGKKAAVVMTGDDHAGGATAGRFDSYLAASTPGCSVANWECIRGTSYVYPEAPLTNAQAVNYTAQGFEVALHTNTNCADYTPSSLATFFQNELAEFAAKYSGIPAPVTNRTHCIAWSDWASTPLVSLNNGIRLDTNYYYWPPSWVVPTPGFFTGSGMPMRFANTDGSIIDVYQATTQMTDESGQSFPATIDGLLDNAIGPAGYYGVFTANMHTDSNTGNSKLWSDQIVASAKARGVPVVSAKQMLTWLDGRNNSRFDSIAWTGNTLTFSISVASGANGLQALLPVVGPSGGLTSLTIGATPVAYTLQNIKGVEYAVFNAVAGAYTAVYSTALPPVISAVSAAPGATTATITWVTDKNSNSRVDYGTQAGSLTLSASDAALVQNHSITLTGLLPATTYYFRVTSVDAGNGTATSPGPPAAPATFATIDPTPPVISAITATPGIQGTATIAWSTNKLATSRVDYGTVATNLNLNVSSGTLTTSHSLQLTGLTSGATYYYRVTSADATSNSATAPAPPDNPLSFVQIGTFTVWGPAVVPGVIDAGDNGAVELGMKFRSDISGLITGVRFYKSTANTGVHSGNLWSATGTRLATVTFANETASGWQQANFAAPVAIAANTTYIVSYYAPNGRYSINSNFFAAAGVDTPPLHALRSGVDGLNGVFKYGATSQFPNESWNASNYWVDVVFMEDNLPPVISNVTSTTTPTSVTITWTTNKAANSQVIYGTNPASLTLTATNNPLVTSHSVTIPGLTTGTQYYFRVRSTDAQSNVTVSPIEANQPLSFTPSDTTPPIISAVVASPGTTSATVTWTTDELSDSVVNYGTSPAALNLAASNPSLVTSHTLTLTTLAPATTYYYRVTSKDAANNSSSFPSSSASSFTTIDNTPPVITGVVAVPGVGGTATITWTTNKPSNSRVDFGTSAGTLNLNVSDASMVTAHSVTLTGLTVGTTYHFRVTSADPLGNAATSPVEPNPPLNFVVPAFATIWSSAALPAIVDGGDSGAVELGLKFRSDIAGLVTGVRFYKSTANTGTHTGSLWSSTGTRLATVTFTNETASGWQQATFPTPVSIAANTTYIISYYAPNGRYSINTSFFAAAGVDAPPLRALQSGVDGLNGVYRYGSSSAFPNQSWNASNYWVDVVFTSNDAVPPTVTAFTIPATSSSLAIPITAFTATDNTAVTGYLVTQTATAPSATDTGWSSSAPTSYTVASAGSYTLYAWAKDGAQNVSASRSAPVVVTLTDTTPPVVNTFALPATATTLTVPITSLTATDNVLVTGYFVSESSTPPAAGAAGWTAAAPTSFTFATAGAKVLYAWAKDASGNVSASRTATTTITLAAGGPAPAGWFTGDIHVHRSCGGAPEATSSLLTKMAVNNLAAISLLADAGNGEVKDPVTDLPLVNGQDDPISTPGRIVHWDVEWHWDATYTQFPHQALGGHILALGLTEAEQIWRESTYSILEWARARNAIAGFAHMQYLNNAIPQSLDCCTPIEYPVEVALGSADFISEDVDDADSGIQMNPDAFIQAYYRLLNTGFRPGFAAGTDYPCNSNRPLGALLTYAQPAGGQMTYRKYIEAIKAGRTVVSRNGHSEFLALTVNGTATPGDQVNLAAAGSVPVSVQWTALQNITGTIELVSNGVVVATNPASVAPGSPSTWNTTVNFPKSGWLAARRMGPDGHQIHTAAVFVIVNGAPIRASVADAQFYVDWMDNLLTRTAPGGPWNSFYSTDLALAQSRYQSAKAIFQQIAVEAGGAPAAPVLSTIAPASGARGAAVPVTITGTNLTGTTLNLPTGITVSGTPTINPVQITATLSIAANAAVGPANITVTGPGGVSNPVTFAVTESDSTPPVVSSIAATPGTGGTAVVTWSTNEPANSRVEYGTNSSNLNLSAIGTAFVTAHSVTLTGLTTGAIYYYRVISADASGNSATTPASPSAPLSFTQTASTTIWGSTATPVNITDPDTTPVELGVKFRSDVAGQVIGVRFYKGPQNTGTHVGTLWSSSGVALGSVTFTNETASGWQQANFATPIPIAANTTYIVSYHAPNGRYSGDVNYFASSSVYNPPLRALQNGTDGPNGVYIYAVGGGFPVNTWQSANYWVDVVFVANP